MARCGCAANGEACACLIVNGSNTTVTGDGSPTTPYKINVAVSSVVLQVQDTPSIDLSLSGLGTPASPWLLQADRIGFGTSVDYTTVYNALRSMGMPQAAAILLSRQVGPTPAVDPEANTKPMFLQSPAASFTHALSGATGVFEKITEVSDLTIQESGLYEVTCSIYGSALIQAEAASATQTTAITFGAIYKNGAVIAGTECVAASVLEGSLGAGVPTEPVLQMQATGSSAQFVSLVAGDVLSIYGGRAFSGSVATAHSILSNTNGRTSLAAMRVRPA
jgi:hypothetical protein